MLLRESLQSDRPAPQRGDSDSVATRNTVKMSSAAAMMSLSTTMMSPVSTNTSTLGHASDSGTSAATIGIIVGILAVLLVIIVVLVVILLRRRNNARSDTADARPVGRKQKPAQQHALPLPPAAIAENGRRLAAVETLPYIPPQPVPVNGGRHGNKDTIGSRDTYDGAYNGRSAADQDPSLMLRPSIDPVQNEAYEDVIAVSIPHREYTPLNDYENVIINNMKTPASREPSRNSQYSTTSEDAHLLASRQPSAQAPALQTIQGSLSSESMSLVDESAYASPEELVAVIRRHAAAYENLGICAAPLKPALSAALSAPGPKPKVPPRRHNKQLEATASDASHLPMVDRIYADDYYDNSELLRAGVTTEPTGADASLEDSYESSMTSPHAYDDVIHQSSRDSAGVMRGQLSTSAPVASDSIGVSSTAGAALYDSGNECHEAIGAQNSTAGLIPTGRNHGYEEVELLKPSAKSTVAPHQTYERLTSKQYREIPSSEIHKVNMVGKGSFGEVWLGKWITPDGKSVDVAVKSLHSTCDALSKGKLLEEANLLGRFHHRNIVQLHGVTQSSTNNQQPQLVLQWAERGCLLAWLRTTSQTWVCMHMYLS
ncbi:uncharacterized protein LOC135812410 [Sycon ciliatum]|uniref:uncharacterized protein LOC135812410 n=1 Tax=Sycon ciliatum TaxID=27933 RepID=UPI0031F6A03F